jgi:hypothetical protein
MCVLNGLVSMRFTEGPQGGSAPSHWNLMSRGWGTRPLPEGPSVVCAPPESRPRNKSVWYHLLRASSRQYLVPCTVAWSARPDWVN